MKSQLKVILILLYFLKDIDVYIERLVHFSWSISGIIYIFLFCLLLLSVFIVAFIKNNYIRIISGFVFYVSAISYDSYLRIMSEPFDYNAFINMIDAAGSLGEALDQYGYLYIKSATFGLLLFLGVAIKPHKWQVHKLQLKSIPILTFLIFTYLIFFKGGSGALGLPSVYTPLSYTSLILYELSQDEFGLREGVSIKRSNDTLNHDIVYIIDESVAANYLDINNNNGVNTGLKKAYPSVNMFNYGYAASIANCSMSTNITLRYGGTRIDYKKTIASKPSIWRYAQNANLKTVYVDAQRSKGELQNGMTKRELNFIDEFIQFDDISVQNRDQEVAKQLIELINNDTNEFIFVNKVGLHFPIHDKYPDGYLKYRPALQRGKWGDVSDTGSREGFNGTEQDWLRYRNSYRNAIEWNVGEFFNKLLNNANLNKALIIYTSDHGQDLHERKKPGNNTHCSANPNIEEGLVPLVILQGDSIKTLNWKSSLKLNKHKSSHYNIFPTLLKVMKYDSLKIAKTYGNSLDIPTKDDFTFNKFWNARLGNKARWKKIEIDKIVSPPKSDYLKNY